jgi:hypothetical protein
MPVNSVISVKTEYTDKIGRPSTAHDFTCRTATAEPDGDGAWLAQRDLLLHGGIRR